MKLGLAVGYIVLQNMAMMSFASNT